MRKTKSLAILSVIVLFLLMGTACGVIGSKGVPSEDSIATSVAATVNAQPGGDLAPAATDQPGNLPLLDTASPSDTAATVPPLYAYPVSVAFVAPDKNAYYWNESLSSPITLTSSADVERAVVSPDGTQVALTRTTDWVNYTLEVVNTDGSGLRTLLSPSGFAALPRPADSVASIPNQLSWVPGTHALAMTTRITYDGPGYQTGENLYLVDTTTSEIRALFTVSTQWGWHYAFSPDGSKIAVSFPEGMDIYNSSGSKLDHPVLTYPFVNTASEYAWVASPVWSANSNTLVAVVPPQEPWATSPANSSVYRISADGLSSELLFNTQMSFRPMEIAAISPDLSKLAFLVPYGSPTDNLYTLRLANIDGSGLTDYTTGKINRIPVWSPDNSKFFYRDDASGAWIGQPGSAPVSIPDFNNTRDLTWIDSNRYIGASGPEGGWKLLLGTIGSPTGVIYSSTSGGENLQFTVNR